MKPMPIAIPSLTEDMNNNSGWAIRRSIKVTIGATISAIIAGKRNRNARASEDTAFCESSDLGGKMLKHVKAIQNLGIIRIEFNGAKRIYNLTECVLQNMRDSPGVTSNNARNSRRSDSYVSLSWISFFVRNINADEPAWRRI